MTEQELIHKMNQEFYYLKTWIESCTKQSQFENAVRFLKVLSTKWINLVALNIKTRRINHIIEYYVKPNIESISEFASKWSEPEEKRNGIGS